jgi:hypothetical protein
MSDQKPSVGRVVHYVSYGTPGGEYKSECRAAMVTAVPEAEWEGAREPVSLCVLNPEGLFFKENVPHEESDGTYYNGGSWHWPERV